MCGADGITILQTDQRQIAFNLISYLNIIVLPGQFVLQQCPVNWPAISFNYSRFNPI